MAPTGDTLAPGATVPLSFRKITGPDTPSGGQIKGDFNAPGKSLRGPRLSRKGQAAEAKKKQGRGERGGARQKHLHLVPTNSPVELPPGEVCPHHTVCSSVSRRCKSKGWMDV